MLNFDQDDEHNPFAVRQELDLPTDLSEVAETPDMVSKEDLPDASQHVEKELLENAEKNEPVETFESMESKKAATGNDGNDPSEILPLPSLDPAESSDQSDPEMETEVAPDLPDPPVAMIDKEVLDRRHGDSGGRFKT